MSHPQIFRHQRVFFQVEGTAGAGQVIELAAGERFSDATLGEKVEGAQFSLYDARSRS